MAKLYLFGIGGTGSRVIKSLTMLLASGVKTSNNQISEIIPIIIDPHEYNNDLRRTQKLLLDYQKIYEKLGNNRNGFFSTKISNLNNDGLISFELDGVNQQKFKNYINYSALDKSNKALASLLFSEETLEIKMDIGFVGNPNIGSIVLNQFTKSKVFQSVASSFSAGDRIFIISSIFGGTGAAGFPLLVKNFRNANAPGNDISNGALLADAPIGAVTVLPYFGVQSDPTSPIKNSDFITKTKAALAYYQNNLSGQNIKALNAHYYVGDTITANYDNDPGENGQKNKAHFIEVASALSIINFMNLKAADLVVTDSKPQNPTHYEYAIRDDKPEINFEHLEEDTKKLIAKPLTKYYLFKLFIDNKLKISIQSNEPFTTTDPKLDSSFTSTTFFNEKLGDFNKAFGDWLNELENNKRGFKPFNQNVSLNKSIVGIEAKEGMLSKKLDFKYYINELNKTSTKQKFVSSERKLIELFNDTLEKILNKKFDYFKNSQS